MKLLLLNLFEDYGDDSDDDNNDADNDEDAEGAEDHKNGQGEGGNRSDQSRAMSAALHGRYKDGETRLLLYLKHVIGITLEQLLDASNKSFPGRTISSLKSKCKKTGISDERLARSRRLRILKSIPCAPHHISRNCAPKVPSRFQAAPRHVAASQPYASELCH